MEDKLTKTQKKILKSISKTAGMTPAQIIKMIGCAPRTARYSLKKLCELALIRRVPYLEIDMRTCRYFLMIKK